MGECILEARGLRKQFFRKGRDSAHDFDAVAPTDLDLEAGKLVALMGRSGSGKSTLLNMLGGVLAPTEGTVSVGGTDLYALSDTDLSRIRNERIGMIPQGQSALHALTVLENVTLPYLMYRSDDGVEERAFELLKGLDIAPLADAYPRQLSGGELRRVAIARALVCSPVLVLADEPTSDLDDANTDVVLQTLRRVADEGAAVLVATHEPAITSVADRVLRMDAGTVNE